MNGKKAKMRNGKKKNGKLNHNHNFVYFSLKHTHPSFESNF